jgi:hypothetical protein
VTPPNPNALVPPPTEPAPKLRRSNRMEPFVLLAFLVGWIALQVWVLPKMGVRT